MLVLPKNMGKYIEVVYTDGFNSSVDDKYGNCELCGKYCEFDPHHTITRSRGGKDTVKICRKCHDWIGGHPNEAEKLNLYIRGYKIWKNQ
jgi:heterodisulfide reductase subunit A-like polyferredoxin